jgi:hypothetical protein
MNRRNLLRASAFAVPAIALSGCGVISANTVNGVTTYTINVAKLLAYTSGAAALAAAFLAIPGVSVLIGGTAALIETAVSDMNAAVPAINTAANGSATISFNTTSVPAFISSLEKDASNLLTYAQAAEKALGTSVSSTATTYYNAIIAAASALSALVSIGVAAKAPVNSTLTVEQALALVHIKAPA